MSRPAWPAGASRTAETAELRKAGADRPQSKARRGSAAGEGKGRNCGTTAEELRKVSSLSPVHLIPAPPSPEAPALSLVPSLPPENSREDSPHRPPAARAVLMLYIRRLPSAGYQGSCVFHGEQGCTLPRSLRSDVCNAYFCAGLDAFITGQDFTTPAVVLAGEGGRMRTSRVLKP